ncbi:MAG: sensor histidine kinase [Cyanobium sp.]|nr:MAG: sensor histidine kinase [Cyanobium sp.]
MDQQGPKAAAAEGHSGDGCRDSLSSIRRRLQASSLLAVLAGYGVLLLANRQLNAENRIALHNDGVDQLQRQFSLAPVPADAPGLQERINRVVRPGALVWLELANGIPFQEPADRGFGAAPGSMGRLLATASAFANSSVRPSSFEIEGRTFLSSSRPVALGKGMAELHVLEDFSIDAERERQTQLLLIAFAGVTALFTSALLRLALRRGLQPLDQLVAAITTIQADSLSRQRLEERPRPEELEPIALAFDALLERLALSFERQRAFADGVAHELRTPITLISGYARRLLRQEALAAHGPAESPRPLALIQGEAERMGRLVSDLLDIARDDTGQLVLSRQRLDVEQELLKAYERLAGFAGERLRLRAPLDGPVLEACGDGDRLQQCLTNLVENALKHTADGPIELFASPDGPGSPVLVHVRDHGAGVPDAEKEIIFERFVQGSGGQGTAAARRGSGIGLSVVRLLMRRMGGEARVVDGPDGGADFQLSLPPFTPSEPLPSA